MAKKVAIQGFEGSFHQIAAQNYFRKDVEIVPCNSFTQVIKAVASGEASSGVMAIENSTAGSILQNYDLLQRSNLYITGEIYLQIRQHLLMLPGQNLEGIKKVKSHPMALYQCRKFLEKHPEWRLVETDDTALSAQHLKEQQKPDVAVIASDLAAELYDLEIVQKDVHSEKNNYTRFLIINKKKKRRDSKLDHKSSLYFQVDDTPGCLSKVLQCIGERNINLSKVQSFPVPGLNWQYFFHADLEFAEMHQFDDAIECIAPLTKRLRILGVYKKGVTI